MNENRRQPPPTLPPRDIRKTVVLVGLMGAGKSAVGRRLAARLGLDFVDADSEIESAAGCSIEDIFTLHGEAAFRDCERRVLARLLGSAPHVLSTGGGAFIDAEIRNLVGETGISVWLRVDLETLVRRTARRSNRPLLKQGNARDILKGLIDTRYPIYAQADIVVDGSDGPVEATVDQVMQGLHTYLSTGRAVS